MPNHEEHVQSCIERFGLENIDLCAKVRRWLDDPLENLGYRHRMYRHDLVEDVKEVERRFGELGAEMARLHILEDYSRTWREFDLDKVEHRLVETSKKERRIRQEALSTYDRLLGLELRRNEYKRNNDL